ncbi:MAG TPA: signal peptidase II [Solirubrobacteraceae bacterium]|nr:signal peptidase II [Solirubrobacteraceae bacterium]
MAISRMQAVGPDAPDPKAATAPRVASRAWGRALIVMVLVLIADQVTKHTLAAGIGEGEVRRFIPGIHLVHVRNTGVAFGFFSGGGALVLVFTLAALAVLIVYFTKHPDRPWLWLPTGLLIGGALGNLYDRIHQGSVTDFIKLPLWPAFNVADMAITFGVLALLFVLEGGGRRR